MPRLHLATQCKSSLFFLWFAKLGLTADLSVADALAIARVDLRAVRWTILQADFAPLVFVFCGCGGDKEAVSVNVRIA